MKISIVKMTTLLLAALVIIMISLTMHYCTLPVAEEVECVEAEILDASYRAGYFTPMKVGKVYIQKYNPPYYIVYLRHEDITISVNNRDLYKQYEEQGAKTAPCKLYTTYYPDGRIKRSLKYAGWQ